MTTATTPPAWCSPCSAADDAWLAQLQACFAQHARTRMAGLAVCHPGVQVQALGFARWHAPAAPEEGLLGVLITPWFLNLVWRAEAPSWSALGVGQSRTLALAGTPLPFLGACEPELGAYASCSLMSPLLHLADHRAAVVAAEAVLHTLQHEARQALAAQASAAQVQAASLAQAAAQAPQQPGRRAFFSGRATAGAPRP